jgi:hypothetical protein
MTDDEMKAAVAAGFAVRGDSYPVKEELKVIGCGWYADGGHRCWVAPNAETFREATAIVVRGPLVEANPQFSGPLEEALGFKDIARAIKVASTGDLVREIRRRGVRCTFDAPETLADAVAGYPPTIDDLAGKFDWERFVGAADGKAEGR